MKNKDFPNKFSFESILVLGSYVLLFFFIYQSAYTALIIKWSRGDYSYCYLIPFIVLYLLWEKKNHFFDLKSVTDWRGFWAIVIGLLFFWLGELGGEYYIMFISSWLILMGLCLLYFGFRKFKVILFPLFFILTMFPLPHFLNNRITLELKLISSKIGVLMMQAYGMSAYREGNVIDLGFTQLQVVDACSGLRYLFPMVIMSILVVYYYPARIWKRLFIVFSSIPLTIFSNSLRIALTGILSERFGPKVVEGFFHDFEGLLIFMFTLGILLLEIWIMNRLFPELKKSPAGPDGEVPEETPETGAGAGASVRSLQFILSVVLLVLTLGLSQGIGFREAIPMARPFDQFPRQIGEWKGERQVMESKFIEELDFTDYFMADYENNSGRAVNFYVAYYESQRKGESVHSPASCLTGGGWNFKQAGRREIKLKDGSVMPVKRALIEKEPVRQLSYYWFPSRDRILTNAWQMKIYNFWDALTRQRTDGALVRVITLVYKDEKIEDAEKRIQEFISEIQPVLKTFLPQ